MAMQHNDSYSDNTYGFVNNITTPEGGTHVIGFRNALTKTFNDYARKNKLLKENEANLSGEDIREGLTVIISVKIEDPQGKNIVSAEQEITFDEQGEAVGELILNISKPHLWNGRKDPFLYKTITELLRKGQITDRVEEKIGIRYFRVDPDKGFFLNDEPLQLRGASGPGRNRKRPFPLPSSGRYGNHERNGGKCCQISPLPSRPLCIRPL